MKLKTIRKVNLENKTVLLRVNFDVLIKNGRVIDASRILAHLPTINFLLKQKAKIILISHLGRPRGIDRKYSLKQAYLYLKKTRALNKVKCSAEHKKKFCALVKNLKFIGSLDKIKIKKEVEKLKLGEIILLENLRFYPGEKMNDKNFAKFLASLANVYVNDAFAVCHRSHASVSAITKYLPSYAGLLLEKEIKNLSEVLANPQKPLIVLMGGAKISTKLPVLKTLAKKADKILIGGALANDLLKAEGYKIGQSLSEKGTEKLIKGLRFKIRNKIEGPVDVRIKQTTTGNRRPTTIKNLKVEELSQLKNKDFKILDIGQKAIKLFTDYLKGAKMIVWNGPMGLFEEKPFDRGTKKIAREILKNRKAKTIIGGGETIAALQQANLKFQISNLKSKVFISTGGGAMLEFLTGKELPGIKPLIK